MKKICKNEIGVTLMVLVITIIVLLILTGVTIVTLTGDNGIVNKAKDAKMQSEISDEKEKLDLAIIELIKYDGEITNREKLEKQLKNKGFQVDENNLKQLGNGFKFTGGKYKNYKITNDGDIKSIDKGELFYSDLKIGNDVVYKGYEAENSYDAKWSIYYADDNNVYLIKKLGYNLNLKTKSDDGELTYGGIKDLYSDSTKNRFPIYLSNWMYMLTEKNISKTPYSFPGVEYLLDSNNWIKFKNEYADYVIGAPTIELMQKSLEKEREQKGEEIPVLDCYIDDTLMYPGYQLNLSSNIPSSSVNYNDTFTSAFLGSTTYWTQPIWEIYKGKLYKQNYGNTFPTRPIICLKSDVKINENEEGSYTLSL